MWYFAKAIQMRPVNTQVGIGVWLVVLLPHNTRNTGSILTLGIDCVELRILPVTMWLFSGSCGFLPPAKDVLDSQLFSSFK